MNDQEIDQDQWDNLYELMKELEDNANEASRNEWKEIGFLYPRPRVAIYFREDGLYFQFIDKESRIVFRLNRDRTWDLAETINRSTDRVPKNLEKEMKIIYDGPVYRRIMKR